MDLPIPGQRDSDRQRGDDFFNLEGAMIFVVQLPCGAACFDVASAEHHQVSYLVNGGFLLHWVSVPVHLFLGSFQSSSGLVVYRPHPVSVYRTGHFEQFVVWWVQCCRVESVIRIEGGYPVTDCN